CVHGVTFRALMKPGRRLHTGDRIAFGGGLTGTIVSREEDGSRLVELSADEGDLMSAIGREAEAPLPPYIRKPLQAKERYQTVYSKITGSAASPTAGLHFTKPLLKALEDKGVIVKYITLHVGLGTFRPVSVEDVQKHKMHSEFYSMDQETADLLNQAKKDGKPITAVGTTTVRTLETILNKYDHFKECSGFTDIFIYPGYTFKAIDRLITNFHLPKSTLLMLVSAFASKEIMLHAYEEAVKEKYRFFSFGDSMIIK
ncbi:MAG TPA: tRNA preQ1(34) S-adenosylmethionine ribosyltransferase-isomerase QueA, partial [Bacillota bacterium]|nr:tRNA preQ1(34) S-adenosylmethionine ribosyltransferase-isomerase QueA [Bacillota bacterium]